MGNSASYWQARIRQASNEETILAIVSQFFASLPRDGVARLPLSSRPEGAASRDEVIAHSVQVARDELLCSGPSEVRDLLREMATVLSEASARLTNLALGPPSGL
jgi:hypothetical protein